MIFAAKLYEEKVSKRTWDGGLICTLISRVFPNRTNSSQGLESGIGKIVTLIAGTGPVEAQKEYQELAIREGDH